MQRGVSYRENNRETLRIKARKYYEENSKERKEYSLGVYKRIKTSNPERIMYSSAKARAKKRGFDFSIDLADIIIPSVCRILGIPLIVNIGKVQDTSPTLDRVNNKLGYIKNNVRVISYKANRLKNTLTPETLERILQYIKGEI